VCQALNQHFDAASQSFECSLAASNSPLISPSRWYLALCHLRNGAINKAVPLLKSLETDKNFGEKARQILIDMGEK
jgi:Tfp pilus assembly protein PilF